MYQLVQARPILLDFVQFILSDALTVLMSFKSIIRSMFIVSITVLATCQWLSDLRHVTQKHTFALTKQKCEISRF